MKNGGFIGGCFAYFIKVVGVTAVLAILLIAAIMIRFDIPLDYVLHESDPTIEAELETFLDPNTIKSEIIDALPLGFYIIPSKFEFFKDIFTVKQAIDGNGGDPQVELYKGLAFGLFSFLVVQVVFFIYRIIRKIADSFSVGFLSTLGGIVSFLQIAYIVPIISILLRDTVIESFYAKTPVLMFVVFVAIIMIILGAEYILNYFAGIKHKENFGLEVKGLLLGVLFSASCLWASLSINTAFALQAIGEVSIDVIVNIIFSITIAAVTFIIRYTKKQV